MNARGERGSVAIGAVALLLVLALVAGAALVAGRGLLLDERTHGSADAVALAAASVLELRYGGDIDGGGARVERGRDGERRARGCMARRGTTRRDAGLDRVRAWAARPVAARGACDRASLEARPGSVRARRDRLCAARPGGGLPDRRRTRAGRGGRGRRSGARPAGLAVRAGAARAAPRADSTARGSSTTRSLRPGDRSGASTPRACSDSRDPWPQARGCCRATSCSWALPAHHVGLVVAPGLAVEAPHRGAQVRVEPLGDGGWTGAGRVLPPAAGGGSGDGDLVVPAYVPVPLRTLVGARGARRATAPGAARGATRGRERIRSDGRLAGRRAGHRAVHARAPGPPAGIRSASAARSSPARRSRRRRGSCTTCSSARRAMSPRRSRPTTPAPWCSSGRGRVRRGPTSLG